MTISYAYHPKLGFVEVKLIGQVSVDEVKKVTHKGIELGKMNNTVLFLIDSSELEEIPFIDLYFLPELYNQLGLDRRSRIGHVLPRNIDAADNAHFYELVTINRGWQVKSFTNREDALFWLKSKNQTNK